MRSEFYFNNIYFGKFNRMFYEGEGNFFIILIGFRVMNEGNVV